MVKNESSSFKSPSKFTKTCPILVGSDSMDSPPLPQKEKFKRANLDSQAAAHLLVFFPNLKIIK